MDYGLVSSVRFTVAGRNRKISVQVSNKTVRTERANQDECAACAPRANVRCCAQGPAQNRRALKSRRGLIDQQPRGCWLLQPAGAHVPR